MEGLRHQDWLNVHEFLLDLHSAPTLALLPARILGGLRRVLAFDSASVQDDRGGVRALPWLCEDEHWQPERAGLETGVRMMTHWDPEFGTMREAFFAVSAEKHPHTAYYRRTGDGQARRLSEIMPMDRLRRTMFYQEISRQNRLRWQLTAYLPLPGTGTLTLAACREGCTDFSTRDQTLLEVLRPHVGIAWRRGLEAAKRELSSLDANAFPDAEAGAQTLRALGLTLREAQVLFWVAQGKTNAEVGLILGITGGTAKCYVEQILRKLDCPTRTAAARTALETLVN